MNTSRRATPHLRTLVVILSFIVGMQVSAQEAYEHYTNYYAIESSIVGSSAGLLFSPAFSVYRSAHKIDAGVGVKFYDVWKNGQGLIGTYLSYKYYPNKRKNDFNLYFGYHNLLSVHDKGKRFAMIYDEASDTYRFPSYVYLLENMVGMGFDFQMGNRFYMFSDFSVGAVLDWREYSDAETQFEVRSTGLIRLGLAYNVGQKRAK